MFLRSRTRASIQVDLFEHVSDGRVSGGRISETSGNRERHRAHRGVDLLRIRSPPELAVAQNRCVPDDGLLQRHGDGTARAAG